MLSHYAAIGAFAGLVGLGDAVLAKLFRRHRRLNLRR
jgi:hypothetical protein